jgi:toxin-antitoxin system PIN domain toxin
LRGFIRLVTHPRVFRDPTPIDRALEFMDAVRAPPHRVAIAPGPRHWTIFESLVRMSAARGSLAADAYMAALAIEAGCEWITTDPDFGRFPGLRWRHPLS